MYVHTVLWSFCSSTVDLRVFGLWIRSVNIAFRRGKFVVWVEAPRITHNGLVARVCVV